MSSPRKKKGSSAKRPVVIEGEAVEIKTEPAPTAKGAKQRKAPPPPKLKEETGLAQIATAADAEGLIAKIESSMREAHRPSGYCDEMVADICGEIASGKTIKQVSEIDGMPSERTISRWQLQYPEFREKVAAALRLSIDSLAQHALNASRGHGDGQGRDDIAWARFQVETDFAVMDRNLRTLTDRGEIPGAIPGDNAKEIGGGREVIQHDPFERALAQFEQASGVKLTELADLRKPEQAAS